MSCFTMIVTCKLLINLSPVVLKHAHVLVTDVEFLLISWKCQNKLEKKWSYSASHSLHVAILVKWAHGPRSVKHCTYYKKLQTPWMCSSVSTSFWCQSEGCIPHMCGRLVSIDCSIVVCGYNILEACRCPYRAYACTHWWWNLLAECWYRK